MKRDELVRWLDATLDVHAFPDPSLNGLQVEGAREVHKVAFAVDSSLSTFEQAADVGADMLIVHHGLFWGGAEPITGMMGRRVKVLLTQDVSLYAAHIPLDAHHELGNNWGLARILEMSDLEPFGDWQGFQVGVKGRFPNPVPLRELADRVEKELGESVLVHAGGAMEVATLGIVSGAAARDVAAAADEGLDAFLTGEPKHDVFHVPFERGINALFAGHYMTETVGVNLLKDRIEREFDLAVEFLLLPTGL